MALRSIPRRLEAKSSATSRAYAAFSACSSDLPLSCTAVCYGFSQVWRICQKAEHVQQKYTASRIM